MKKTDSRWGDAHLRLRAIYEERVPRVPVLKPDGAPKVDDDGKPVVRPMSQEEFAAKFGLGTQGMVWQYLQGYRPLNYDAAAKFAEGLGCKIDDFCPEMAQTIRQDILPAVRKYARRGMMVLLASALQLFTSPDAQARALLHNAPYAAPSSAKHLSLIHIGTFWRKCKEFVSRIFAPRTADEVITA